MQQLCHYTYQKLLNTSPKSSSKNALLPLQYDVPEDIIKVIGLHFTPWITPVYRSLSKWVRIDLPIQSILQYEQK